MSFALPEALLESINNAEPEIPNINPMILFVVSFSFNENAAIMVIKIGVVSINKEA
jgi:hypothetical protein